jgi:adenylate cyclase
MFTDLQGFTTLSDSMDPVKLVRVLNMYLNEMSEVILALGGTIDKFEGDAIMAFFGAPIPMSDHAIKCCKAALRMKKMETIINNQLMAEKILTQPLHTRIGINSGDMVVGNVGSLKRIDYTIIGGNVNIAARIETVNKDYNTSVLIGEQTYELVKDYFVTRMVDTVKLRGISKPVVVYELLGEKTLDKDVSGLNKADDVSFEILEELEVQEDN